MPTMWKERYAFHLPFTGDLGAVLAASRAEGRLARLAEPDFFIECSCCNCKGVAFGSE